MLYVDRKTAKAGRLWPIRLIGFSHKNQDLGLILSIMHNVENNLVFLLTLLKDMSIIILCIFMLWRCQKLMYDFIG